MSDFDLVIRRGTVATAADTTACDIGIKDGVVAIPTPRSRLWVRSSRR